MATAHAGGLRGRLLLRGRWCLGPREEQGQSLPGEVRKPPACLNPGLEMSAHRQGTIVSSAPSHPAIFLQSKALSWTSFAF